MKPQDRPEPDCPGKIPPRHPVAVLLSASVKYIVTGFALAGVAMHPEIHANVIAERDRPGSPDEPPVV